MNKIEVVRLTTGTLQTPNKKQEVNNIKVGRLKTTHTTTWSEQH